MHERILVQSLLDTVSSKQIPLSTRFMQGIAKSCSSRSATCRAHSAPSKRLCMIFFSCIMPRSLAAFTGNPRASRTRRKHLSQSPYLVADHTSLIPGRNADAPALQELLAERAVLLRRPSKPAAPSTWRTLSLRGPPRAHLRVRVSLLCSGRAIQHKCWPNSTIHWKRVFHCSLQLIGT